MTKDEDRMGLTQWIEPPGEGEGKGGTKKTKEGWGGGFSCCRSCKKENDEKEEGRLGGGKGRK